MPETECGHPVDAVSFVPAATILWVLLFCTYMRRMLRTRVCASHSIFFSHVSTWLS